MGQANVLRQWWNNLVENEIRDPEERREFELDTGLPTMSILQAIGAIWVLGFFCNVLFSVFTSFEVFLCIWLFFCSYATLVLVIVCYPWRRKQSKSRKPNDGK